MLWLILVMIALISCYYNWIYRPHQFWKELGVFHLKPTPFVGNMWKNIKQEVNAVDIIAHFYKFAKDKGAKYIGVYQFSQPVLVVTDVELIKKITVKDFNHFVDHMKFIDEEMDPLFGRNVFSLKGTEWREMRNTLSPAFTSSKMRAMFSLINECAEHLTDFFLKESSSKGETLHLEMKDVFTRYANDVIATATFGYKCDSLKDRENTFYLMAKDASDFTGIKAFKFSAYSISPFLTKLFKIKIFSEEVCSFFHNQIVDSITYREKERIVRPDMIHLLMQAKKGQLKNDDSNDVTENTGKKMDITNDDITSQALLFFLAGFDTTSTLMCYIAYELAVNPDLQVRLQDEVDTAMNECKGQVGYDVLMKMTYMDMVVCETLRKWPPSIISDRNCVKTYVFNPIGPDQPSVTIQPGTPLWIPIFSIHRDPEFFPDPDRFDPERFNAENKKNIDPYAYCPFGMGPRNCIGSRFALMETKVLFLHLLSKFDFVVIDKTLIPIKLCKKSWNLNVEGGMWIGLRARKTDVSSN